MQRNQVLSGRSQLQRHSCPSCSPQHVGTKLRDLALLPNQPKLREAIIFDQYGRHTLVPVYVLEIWCTLHAEGAVVMRPNS